MAKGKKTGGRDFKKGYVSNPNGRPKLPEDLRVIKRLTQSEITSLISKYLQLTRDELTRAAQDKSLPIIELYIASVIQKGVIGGDTLRLNFLFDRTIGKVADKIEAQLTDASSMTPEARRARIAELNKKAGTPT